jgi:hypothetical protein
MGRCGDRAGGARRADNFTLPTEWRLQLYTHFKVDLTVQVDRNMTTCPRDLLCPDDAPYRAAGRRNDLREFLWSRATAYNRKRTTADMFESNIVFHGQHLCN